MTDTIDGTDIPHPADQQALFGHSAAERTLLSSMAGNRLHHAWLISGLQGLGKATLAYRLARFLLTHGQGNLGTAAQSSDALNSHINQSVKARISARSHGDLLAIERAYDEKRQRYKEELTIDQIRQIPPFLQSTSAEGGWRMVIIDGADAMNRSAQNAILKGLEEPPNKTLIALVAERPERLLPTIRSRCRDLPLAPLGDADMAAALEHLLGSQTSVAERERLTELADGRPGAAVQLWQADVDALWQDIQAALAPDASSERHRVAATIGADQLRWQYFGDLMRRWLRGLLESNGRVDPVFSMWDKTNQQLADAEIRNLDRKLVTLQILESASRLRL